MKTQNGFVLAFSLLISSIVLALALGIFNILLKQIVLTSTAAESQVAFYAADAGAECALYWDTHNSRVPPDGFDAQNNYLYDYRGAFHLDDGYPDMSLIPVYSPQASIQCGEGSVTFVNPENGSLTNFIDQNGATVLRMTSSFQFEINNKCVKVRVGKNYNAQFQTVIESLGYNVSCSTLVSGANANRVVERAIRVQY